MDYRKIGDFYYLRMDRDDEIISKILEICKKEKNQLCDIFWHWRMQRSRNPDLHPRGRKV